MMIIILLTLNLFILNVYSNIDEAIKEFDKKNYRQAYNLFLKELLTENIQSFYYLGLMNEKGLGMEINEKKAIELYEKGAELGDEKCLYKVGLAYLNGLYGKNQNVDKAIDLLNKAEKKGNIEARIKLGEIYYYGFSIITQDFDKAIKYFKKLPQDNPKAMYYIGLMMIQGQGIKKDVKKGFNMLYKSAMSGYSQAQIEVGKIYKEGKIVEKNYEAAIKWFKKACKEQIEEAAFYIATIYSDREYQNYDELKSYSWHIVASRYGNSNSQAIIDISRKKFSSREIERANKMAENNIKEIFQLGILDK